VFYRGGGCFGGRALEAQSQKRRSRRGRVDIDRASWRVLMSEKTIPEPPPDPRSGDEPVTPEKKKRVPDVKDHISRQLRALYDEVANQPVPERFMDLLGRLDAKSQDE
jgi:hypothetical protein